MAEKKVPLPLRIDPELLRRVDVARGDVSRTRWVERALESALEHREPSEPVATDRGRADVVSPSASSRASAPLTDEQGRRASGIPGVKSARELMLERQRKLNEGKG